MNNIVKKEYISTNPDLDSLDFFIPNIYIDGKGEERPNYQITKKIKNKLHKTIDMVTLI